MTLINSRDYWDARFANDWESRGGGQQSEFFAALALAHLPPWFLARVERDRMTCCDWGCAQGHGTAWLAARLPQASWTGVDFSAVAIESAAARYPDLRFSCQDFTTAPAEEEFDVVFSSNTLEHFADPWRVFGCLVGRARRFLVLLVPFREDPEHREPEHASTFDFGDLGLAPSRGWSLLHAAIVDAEVLPKSRWLGKQVLLIWARAREFQKLGLSLADLRIDTRDTLDLREERSRLTAECIGFRAQRDQASVERDALAVAKASIEADLRVAVARGQELEANAAATRAEATALGERIRELDEVNARARFTIADLERRQGDLQARLTTIEQSLSWRCTAPVRWLLSALRRRPRMG